MAEHLLRTVHGSHLYGLATPASDHDTYLVVPHGARTRHTIRGAEDLTLVPLGLFVRQCGEGVPQALEALFSPLAEPGPLDAYRHGYRVPTGAMVATYTRTIRAFALEDRYQPGSRHETKLRRHALRLALALGQGMHTGRFDPHLPPHLAAAITQQATSPDYLDLLQERSPVQLHLDRRTRSRA